MAKRSSSTLTVVALMAGDAALQAEEESDESLVNEMATIIARIHHIDPPPKPSQYIISRWRKDPLARGSYSYVGPEATGEDYDILGEPVDQALFFAGEATCRTHPATVHGAYISGLRAASEVLESLIGKIEMPPNDVLIPKKNQGIRNPLFERSSIPKVKQRTDPESHRYKARDVKRVKVAQLVEECSHRILAEVGPRPSPPKKYHPNAFLLFQRDKWDMARDRANQAKFGNSRDPDDQASRDEVRVSMGRMWKELPDEEKKIYHDTVEREKLKYKRDIAAYEERLRSWEKAVSKIKEEIKWKLETWDMVGEERTLFEAAQEEERQERAAKEEKEKLKRFYDGLGIDELFTDEDENSKVRHRVLTNLII